MIDSPSVVVSWVTGHQVAFNFNSSLAYTCLRDGGKTILNTLPCLNGPRVFAGRNVMVEQFLKTDGEWLFSIDNDIGWTYDDYVKLLSFADVDERPSIGGIYEIVRDAKVIEPCARY